MAMAPLQLSPSGLSFITSDVAFFRGVNCPGMRTHQVYKRTGIIERAGVAVEGLGIRYVPAQRVRRQPAAFQHFITVVASHHPLKPHSLIAYMPNSGMYAPPAERRMIHARFCVTSHPRKLVIVHGHLHRELDACIADTAECAASVPPAQMANSGPVLDHVELLLKKAIVLDRSLSQAYFQLGNLYSQQRRFAEAVPEYAEAIKLAPNSPDAYYRLGSAYVHLGKKSLAQKEFQVHQRLYNQHLADVDKQRAEIRKFVYSLKSNPLQP